MIRKKKTQQNSSKLSSNQNGAVVLITALQTSQGRQDTAAALQDGHLLGRHSYLTVSNVTTCPTPLFSSLPQASFCLLLIHCYISHVQFM